MKRFVVRASLFLLIASTGFGPATGQDEDADTLNILYWQAVSILNPYLAGGTKDLEAASLVLEPLAYINPDGILVPVLATAIPALDNGGIAEDLTSITWRLRENVYFSDGKPLTPDDVVFSWRYCTNPGAGCSGLRWFEDVVLVEAVDEYAVRIRFSKPKPYPYAPFVGEGSVVLHSGQFADCLGSGAPTCTAQNFGPLGTGPYVVDEFRANDVVTFTANPLYRESGKPHFSRVVIKGGGDAESSARAVLETGEADYAWNLQVAHQVLDAMAQAGHGRIEVGFATHIERLLLNQTNPSPDLPPETRSIDPVNNPHPFLTNAAVRKALSMAIDRHVLAGQLYGEAGLPTCNLINAPPHNVSPNNDACLAQDIAGANALLDEAGILDSDGDGVRELDGAPLRIHYRTSTNALRQDTQSLIKQWWGQIGVETGLDNVSGAVFFGADPASPDTYYKFYADVQMWTTSTGSPDAEAFLAGWLCGDNPAPNNNWLGRNVTRHCDPAFDELFGQLRRAGDPAQRALVTIQLNDLLVAGGVVIPLIYRASVSGVSNRLEGVWVNAWDTELWNIEDWTRKS
ncbi:MAG: peptide ABC transporter substrate-binding protein [Anaerolineaceae bacterium]|nr:peptide ABC transporter substrate-binding protein [Anaerolineaceae bacterium]MDE0609112.1 peptide ABC transporter substrate-binding protein [Anaerolineaceae bacterium]